MFTSTHILVVGLFIGMLLEANAGSNSADILLLINGSESTEDFYRVGDLLVRITSALDIGPSSINIGITKYSSTLGGYDSIYPFQNRMLLINYLQSIELSPNSPNSALGILKVRETFKKMQHSGQTSPKIMIFVTYEYGSSVDPIETIKQAKLAKDESIRIIAIGVANKLSVDELQDITRNQQEFDQSADLNTLQSIVANISQALYKDFGKSCLIEEGSSFQPNHLDFAEFLQCRTPGDTVQYMLRSCPFGQFWDVTNETCTEAFHNIRADPCLYAPPGYTYGMPGHSCRAYWKCVHGTSLATCCHQNTSYIDSLGCFNSPECDQECPPKAPMDMCVIVPNVTSMLSARPGEILIDQIPVCSRTGDVTFVLDIFEGITDGDFILLKDFVADVIGTFKIGTDAMGASILVNGTLVGNTFELDPLEEKLTLQTLVRNLQHSHVGTDAALAIETARDTIRRQGQKNRTSLFVVITDIRSSNKDDIITQANLTKAGEVEIVAIGVGAANFSQELNEIASGPSHVMEVANYSTLQRTVPLAGKLICTFLKTAPTTTMATTTITSTASISTYTEQQTRASSSVIP